MATITAAGKLSVPAQAPPRLLVGLWRDRWVSALVALTVAGLSGLLVALTMPRGPTTQAQALIVMVIGLVVGIIAGLAMRSRRALLLAPLAHAAVFEVGRLGTPGLTVGGVHLDTTYGILALILRRGVHGLIGLLPMLLGAVYGAAFARRYTPAQHYPTRLRHRLVLYLRRGITGIVTVALVALAGLIARPASTPPLLGADGKPIPGSVAELTKIPLGGHDQWIMIRAASVGKPVLLYLSGGPGQSDLPFTRVFFNDLARDFIVVNWDQRGTGKSYPALDPAATWTLNQAVSDTVELTNYLCNRFHARKIYLIGESKARLYFFGVLGTEYNLIEKVNVLRGLLDMSSVMYPQLQGIDFRQDVPRLRVPVYILDGQGELRGRRELLQQWYAQLEAPRKRIYSFADAGHSTVFEEFQAFHAIMTSTILPETYR